MESIIFPETDHSLCLNCQVSKGNPHLCGSCQWYASNVFDKMKKQELVNQKLDEIQNEIPIDVTTNSVSDLIEKLNQKKTMFRNDQIIDVLEQIKETGLNYQRD
jgi:thiamine biosynthesis protein ThiC